MKAHKHPREASRLAALRAYDILDTPRESDFDEIVEVLAKQCAAPISVVNLIDENRQWFKAETGLGVRETPLDTSICAHAILQEDVFIIEDTLNDPRFTDNPLCVSEPNLRFYAGALLKSQDGYALGTLCVLDTQPRQLSKDQIRLIEVMARQVMTQLELRRKLKRQVHHAREAAHRTANLLTVVHSLFSQSRRRAESLDDLAESFNARIINLGRIHERLSSTKWRSADLVELIGIVTNEFSPLYSGRIAVQGSSLTVDAGAAENIAAALFELATNAVKHGALSNETGTVKITLDRTAQGVLLEWRENGGPPVAPPTREGLGTIIVRDVCPSTVHGTADLSFAPGGLIWRLKFGAEQIIEPLA